MNSVLMKFLQSGRQGNMKAVIQHSDLQLLIHFPDGFGQDQNKFRNHRSNILNIVRFIKIYLTYKIIDAESNYFSEGYMVAKT